MGTAQLPRLSRSHESRSWSVASSVAVAPVRAWRRVRGGATKAFVDVTVDKVGTRFPGFPDAAISSSYAGCYDVTPDWNSVISPGPLDGLVIAAGFSGHGFKIAPAVGQLVADLVIDGHSSDPRIPE